VLRAISAPGLGLALSSVGFGAITIFITLLSAERGWSDGWIAITALAVSFIAARLVLGGLPDRIGGLKVALASLFIEAAGQALVWLAASPLTVFVGAALTGAGYSLIYPGFGVEAIRRAPPETRGMVMGAYTACLDLALGIAGPGLGLVAAGASLTSVFLTSTLIVLSGVAVALRLLAAPSSLPKR
jgi:MFS family permease